MLALPWWWLSPPAEVAPLRAERLAQAPVLELEVALAAAVLALQLGELARVVYSWQAVASVVACFPSEARIASRQVAAAA